MEQLQGGYAGGRRLLRQWMCRPLRDVSAINARLDAVQELVERPELVVPLRSSLQGEFAQTSCPTTQMTRGADSEAWGTQGVVT